MTRMIYESNLKKAFQLGGYSNRDEKGSKGH
jgi:hypothetical protein